MATIRAYTDISQSKKLAEILPLESADMYYEPSAGYCTEPSEVRFGDIKYAHPRSIRCWSLAALLDVLPNGIVMNKDSQNGIYHFSSKYIGTYVTTDSPIDACYEMIIRLHEQKLL